MARADTRTLLSLDRFFKIMGVHPLHANGVTHDSLAPATTCAQPLMQYDWQTSDGVSRESIANAIADSEARIAQWLGFKPLPTFEVDERHSMPTPADPSLQRSRLLTSTGAGVTVKLDWGHVVAGGVQGKTAILLSAPVVYSDEDADGYFETATLVVAASVTDPNEIALFLPGEDGAPEFEVRPIKVTISGGNVTIVARREQFVIPALFERLDSNRAIDGANDANFLTVADVYRVWHDPSQQVQFLWENQFGSCGCSITTCATCYLAAQFGCTVVRDYRLGLISGQPALWNAATNGYEFTTYSIARAPDRGRFWYRAGYRDPTRSRPMHDMDPRWERAIAIYAATLLERPFCACKNAENITQRWNVDLGVTNREGSHRLSTKNWLDNPLGTREGAVFAWRLIRDHALGDSVSV